MSKSATKRQIDAALAVLVKWRNQTARIVTEKKLQAELRSLSARMIDAALTAEESR